METTIYKHKIYKVWQGMVERATNPKHKSYKNYGGRGILICSEWRLNSRSFFNWALANGWQEGLQLDRIDVNGNYEPSNCRFVTPQVNALNKRKRKSKTKNKTGFSGVYFHTPTKKFIARIAVDGKRKYIGSYVAAIQAAKGYDEYIIKHNLEQPLNF